MLEELSEKVNVQNEAVNNLIYEEKKNQEKISQELDIELLKFNDYINRLNELNPLQSRNPLTFGLSKKIEEFHREIEKCERKIKQNQLSETEIIRKKKENDEFFRKFYGEKKVWLDRLNEDLFRNLSYSSGFKYFYEAKTVKLLMEGILLEKIEDEIEKELTVKGQALGWDVMNEEAFNQKRRDEEFKLNLELTKIENIREAQRREKEFKEKWDAEEAENKNRREEIQRNWKEIWGQIWLPSEPYHGEANILHQREIMKKVIMDVTFKNYKKILFDVYKFKNIVNNTDEYVILDKTRRYFPDDNKRGINKDESSLDKMMNIIENIRKEEEIIYCDLKPAKEYLDNVIKNNSNNPSTSNASIERLTNIINKIQEIHDDLKKDSTKIIKREVEEIFQLIKNIPDENEQKLFKENLIEDSRLYDVFLPLTTILMVETFISIGKKRTKNYQNKLDNFKQENDKIKLEINEMDGKLKTLNNIEQRVKELSSMHKDPDSELRDYDNAKKNILDMANIAKRFKNEIIQQQNDFLDNIQNDLVN